MIAVDGIKAFHGSMTYAPPNPKFGTELTGDFVYRSFGNEGYWYNKGSSYQAQFCSNIREEISAVDLIEEIESRIEALNKIIISNENFDEVRKTVDNLSAWIDGVKKKVR